MELKLGEIALLPCPFCGAEAGETFQPNKHCYVIGCSNDACGCEFVVPIGKSIRAAWNTRAALQTIDKLVKP